MNRSIYNMARVRVMIIIGCLAVTLPAQTTISLNIGQAAYTIKKELYGALMENWGRDIYDGLYVGTSSSIPNTNGMRNDIIAAFKECGVTCLDWPGGCFAENYNWAEGIGPKASRPGGDMRNGMGTAEYFQLCELTNTIPYITANISNLSVAGMTAWLNYIDTVHPGKLKYWKIGNEPWGGCQAQGVAGISVTSYINKYNQYEAGIPSKWRGNLFRIADGGTGNGTAASYWLDSLMRMVMGKVEGITHHYYSGFTGPSFNFTEAEYYDRLRTVWRMNDILNSCETVMNRHDPDYTVGLMFDEWGAWYTGISGMGLSYQQSTCRDAVIASIHLNLFNNRCRRVWMAMVAQPINVIQALILTKNPPTTEMIKTPTFYVYKMYKVHQNAKMVPTTVNTTNNQSVPLITASSSVDSMGKLHISMCNTHYSAVQNVALTLNNAPGYSICTGTIVNGQSAGSYNDYGVAERVNIQNFTGATLNGNSVNVAMPAHSVVTLELTPPPVGVFKQSVDRITSSFEIGIVAKGKIVVGYSVAERASFTLGLFTIDGRTMVETCKGTLEPGRKTFVWQPKNLGLGTSVYIVKMSSDEEVKSQRVLFQR